MELNGTTYTFVMIKNPKHDPKEPYIYFISDLEHAKDIANHYLKRWKIECCFKNLKTNGFNIEDINLRSDKKIELMMAILAITYLLAVKEGILRHLAKAIPMKKYKDGKIYPGISVFRLGFAIIQSMFTAVNLLMNHIENLLKPLSDTQKGSICNYLEIKNV
jgi:transposase